MIEIVKDNRPKHQVSCKNCHSILAYTDDSVIEQLTGDSVLTYDIKQCATIYQEKVEQFICCPACKKLILVRIKWKEKVVE